MRSNQLSIKYHWNQRLWVEPVCTSFVHTNYSSKNLTYESL